MKRRKAQEDELREKIEAGEADESDWNRLPLPVISYVSMISEFIPLPG